MASKRLKDVFTCYLDVAEDYPSLYGEIIVPRDNDGMGFSLELDKFRKKFVRITIEEIEQPDEKVHW